MDFPASSSLSTLSTTDMLISILSKGLSNTLSVITGMSARFSCVNTQEKKSSRTSAFSLSFCARDESDFCRLETLLCDLTFCLTYFQKCLLSCFAFFAIFLSKLLFAEQISSFVWCLILLYLSKSAGRFVVQYCAHACLLF